MCAMRLTVFFLFLTVISEIETAQVTIQVDSQAENDSLCFTQQRNVRTCRTLEKANSILKEYSTDVALIVQTDVTLHGVFEVADATNISINGSRIIVISCEGNVTGFQIKRTQSFLLSHLTLCKCSFNFSRGNIRFWGAVMIANSSNVLLKKVDFTEAKGTALGLFQNSHMIKIERVTFSKNKWKIVKNNKIIRTRGAGGIEIQETNAENVHYEISDSYFYGNEAPHAKHVNMWDRFKRGSLKFGGFGCGGAVYIAFRSRTKTSSVTFRNCTFNSNVASNGGAIFATFKNTLGGNNLVSIKDSSFSGNNADISGGGVSVGFIHSLKHGKNNTFQISGCNFTENHALVGGGMDIFSTHNKQKDNISISVRNSNWFKNFGVISSAVDVNPLDDENEGFLPTIEFMNCNISENYLVTKPHRAGHGNKTYENTTYHEDTTYHEKTTYHVNTGIVGILKFKVLFRGNMTFLWNKYSAINLVSSQIFIDNHSHVLFYGNYGYNGAAISMYGFSKVILSPYSVVNFSQNHAQNLGGAIFHHDIDQHRFLVGSDGCFLENVEKKNHSLVQTTEVVFTGNNASKGSAMFAGTFDQCYFHCESNKSLGSNWTHYKVKYVFQCIGNFQFVDEDNSTLMSSARRFKFKVTDLSFSAIPGGVVPLPFWIIDDFNNAVHPLMAVDRTVENGNRETETPVRVQERYTLSNKVTVLGDPEKSDVSTPTSFTYSAVGIRQIFFYFNLTLLPCPPGFHNSNGSCECAYKYYTYITRCQKDFSAILKERGRLWVGYIPTNSTSPADLYFTRCELPLCRTSTFVLPNDSARLVGAVCTENRRDILCGKCEKHHSTYFHSSSFACRPNRHCHLGPVLYFVSELVPMFIFFLVVITFDLSFTTGKSVGFILFTQCLNQLTIYVDSLFMHLRTPYQIFYGLFNFEFFQVEYFSFCLWKDAQVLDVIAFKYVTIAIAFALVLAMIALLRSNTCSVLGRLRRRVSTKTSVVHGLSAFLVICYAQCTKITFYILKFSQPVGYKDKIENYYSYYGGLHYMKSPHLIYAIPALASSVLVTTLPPLVLLFYPLSLQLLSLCGLSEHWLVNRTLKMLQINKLVPFIDCFQSCYRDNVRFFAGLYFVYRVAFLLCFSFTSDYSTYLGLLLVFIMGVHSAVQPYKKRSHNVLDSLLFLNLAAINGCVILSNNIRKRFGEPGVASDKLVLAVNTVQLILLYLPMLVVLCKAGRRLYVSFRIWRCDGGNGGGECSVNERLLMVGDILDFDHRVNLSGTASTIPTYQSVPTSPSS